MVRAARAVPGLIKGSDPRDPPGRRALTLRPRSYTSAVSKRAFCPLNGPIAVATARQSTRLRAPRFGGLQARRSSNRAWAGRI